MYNIYNDSNEHNSGGMAVGDLGAWGKTNWKACSLSMIEYLRPC